MKMGRTELNRHTVHSAGEVKDRFDLLIIGGGSAAFAAALEAHSMGARVGMIERGTIGGTCVNVGCIPSKALIKAAQQYETVLKQPFDGLRFALERLDLAALVTQKEHLVATLRQEKYIDLLAAYDITLLSGEATFVDAHTVQVNGQLYHGENIIIATGTRPTVPNISGLHTVDYWTSTEALQPKRIPKHLIIVGAGYIALELGLMYRALGSQVTLLKRKERLLDMLDVDISEYVRNLLEKKGIRVLTGVHIERVEQKEHVDGHKIKVTMNVVASNENAKASDAKETLVIEGDQLLLAAGRTPNTEHLDLARAGVRVGARGEIIVDDTLATSIPHIFAAGDVTLGPQFVYVAAYEGKLAAYNALRAHAMSKPLKRDLSVVPSVMFTHPQIASVGLTEDQARAQGLTVTTTHLPLTELAGARVRYEADGLYKLIFDQKSLRLLGAQIIAPEAGEVIYAATLAIKFGLTHDDLVDTLAPYLTMAEGLRLAALSLKKDVRKLSCCAG